LNKAFQGGIHTQKKISFEGLPENMPRALCLQTLKLVSLSKEQRSLLPMKIYENEKQKISRL